LKRQHFADETEERDGVLLGLSGEILLAADSAQRSHDHLSDVAVFAIERAFWASLA
jgi:hypothetical protein